MRIAVTGSSGFIGTALLTRLTGSGHEVVRLVRRPASSPDEVSWDPADRTIDVEALGAVDAVVHLAGAGIGDHRWTDAHKSRILRSRVDGTTTIARAMAGLSPRPRVLVSQSAIGFYGDTGERSVDESAPQGHGFLADVVRAWERSADPARDAGIRVVHPRSGLVMARNGGAWARMLPLARLGLNGPLGSGRQWWSYVTLADEVAALEYLLASALEGPVNVVAPNPARQRDVAAEMGRVLHRPALLPAPASGLKAVLGQVSSEVLGSIRVTPAALEKDGFTWQHPDLASAVATLVAPSDDDS